MLYGAFSWCNAQRRQASRLTNDQLEMLDKLPDDVREAIRVLGLEPDFTRYACCPRCFAIYLPDVSRPDDPYPRTCTFQETDKPICGAALVFRQEHVAKKGEKMRVTHSPHVVYPYRGVHSWIGDMLQRTGMARTMKGAWKRLSRGRWTDIFHAPAIQTFLGPDGKTLFSHQPDPAIHLVFSLFIDWFNPFGNKQAGKSHSVGAIFLVCLNLPDDIRYKPENICLVGIIPGPKEPETHQLNHLLRPLVDELLVLWNRGVLYQLEKSVHVVRAAVIPLVCDLPALRKAAGFAGHHASHFCSFCKLMKKNMNDLDRSKWKSNTWEEHLRYAAQWRDAPTEADRKEVFKTHGLRWSELLRLPYWDPTQFAVVDAMHNLFLGELRHHCREVWGIDVKDKSGDSKKHVAHTPEQQRGQLLKVLGALRKGSRTALDKIRRGYIVAVAEVNGVNPTTGNLTKAAYRDALLAWVRWRIFLASNLTDGCIGSTRTYGHQLAACS